MAARIIETALAVLALLLAISGGYLALRGVRRDSAAFEEAAQLMMGYPGRRDPDALRWTIARPEDRLGGALNMVTDSLRAAQVDLRNGALLGVSAAASATAGALLAVWA